MLEIFYKTATKIVTAWRSEGKQNIRPVRVGEAKVMLDILPPSNEGASVRDYLYDEATSTLKLSPSFKFLEPPLSSHISVLTAVDATKARPARIKRIWEGRDYFYDCFATQTVKDEFVAGKIAIGDYVIVHFDDIGEQIVTAKVWKSW